MKRLVPLGLASLASLALMAPGAATAADVALVIGNHDYRQAPDALSARADARAVADALKERGYKVTSGTDLDRDEMRRRIAEFAGRLDDEGADRVVVFYSGHTLRSDGLTYLAPIDQGNDSLVEVMLDGVPLDLVLRLAGQEPGEAVVFIDGAQLDGFSPEAFAEPGLAEIEAPEGVLVVSAAAPGRAIPRRSTGQSDFGRQVVEEFLAPGVSVGSAVRGFRSPAWVTGDTDTGLVLVRERPEPVASRVSTDTRTTTRAPDPGAAAEQRLGLTRTERRAVQENLSTLDYDTRGVEGIFGPGTRTALKRWQRANDLAQTGYLTTAQVALLSQQTAAAAPAPEPQADNSAAGQDRAYWARTGGRGTADGHRAYLESYPDGLHASEARRALRRMADSGSDPAAVRERELWRWTQAEDRRADYEDYLGSYPTGIWQPEAEARLAELAASEVAPGQQERDYWARTGGRGTADGHRAYLESYPEGLHASEARQALKHMAEAGSDPAAVRERDLWRQAQVRDRRTDYQTYLESYPNGIWQPEATARLAELAASEAAPALPDPAATEAALELTSADRLSIEQRLAALGFSPGAQDGAFDANTRGAIEGYQRSRGHDATGYLSRPTVAGIVQETRGASADIATGAEAVVNILRGLGQQ